MTSEEMLHRSVEIAAEEQARRMPDFLRRVFSVLLGGVGGTLGFAVTIFVIGKMIGYPFDLTHVLSRVLEIGSALGFLPGVAAGLIYTRISRERHKAYFSFLFGAAAGLTAIFPPVLIILVLGSILPARCFARS